MADATHPLIIAIDRVAIAGAGLPGSAVPVVADDFAMLLTYGAAAAFVLACAVRVPIRPHGSSAYAKVERRAGDFATVGVAVQLRLGDDGRIAEAGIGLTAVGEAPLASPTA